MNPLPDGTYDAFVLDVSDRSSVEITIVAGEFKGHVLNVASTVRLDPIEAVGLPATLVVANGEPHLTIEG